MNLYWVETEDHAEDWFVVANDAEEAATLHEDFEGYAPGDAFAEMITAIPEGITVNTGWPSDEVLLACGATFISQGPTRIVDINNRRFCEGLMESTIRSLDDDRLEEIGKGRPNKTDREMEH
jgi:hypothetical protein